MHIELAETDPTGYHATFVDHDGRVTLTVLLFAQDDEEAKRKARSMVDGQGIDLWHGLRFIEHYLPDPSA